MPKRSRLQCILKWTGAGLCLLLVLAWAISLRWGIGYAQSGEGMIMIEINGGLLTAVYGSATRAKSELHFEKARGGLGLVMPCRAKLWSLQLIVVPLWLSLMIVAMPTACIFWLGRRRRITLGHCQRCGYNLTGNLSGICPECGTSCDSEVNDWPIN